MRTARFFVPEEWVAKNAKAFSIPAGAVHKQITLVLRMKAGDQISLLTGDGQELDGQITEVTRTAIMGTILDTKSGAPLTPHLTICAGMTKRDTFEWMLQKCTELGAAEFIPLITDRVIKRPKDTPKRWQDIVREAAEQSGRFTLPTIHEPMSLAGAMKKTNGQVQIFFHEAGGEKKLPAIHKTSKAALFIGPEGGFSEAELTAAQSAKVHIVTLGDLVLRAETAAIVGATLLRLGR